MNGHLHKKRSCKRQATLNRRKRLFAVDEVGRGEKLVIR
jgi:hypothetical protein